MARRRKNDTGFDALAELLILLIGLLIKMLIRVIAFTYDVITYFTSKYGEKSGNGFFRTYFDTGNYGEFVLYRKATRLFGRNAVLTNLYLEGHNTDMTEIDVLAISNKGIYVLEMKNYAGYIYGSERDKNWTQVLNRWTKNKFYNPLRQNYAHTKSVEKYLELEESALVPITVFSNRSKLSKINVGEKHNVFQYRDALRFMKNNEKKGVVVLSDEQKSEYLVKLLQRSNMDEEVKLKHIEQVVELQETTA